MMTNVSFLVLHLSIVWVTKQYDPDTLSTLNLTLLLVVGITNFLLAAWRITAMLVV